MRRTTFPPREEIAPGAWLDAERALFLTETCTLIVADLHWGYALSHRRAGRLLPDWGDAQLAEKLDDLLVRYQPRRMLWLGDTLHTLVGRTSAEIFLKKVERAVEVVVLRGNHDRGWERVQREAECSGDFIFHHGDQTMDVVPGCVEVVGHWHPAWTWRDGAGLHLKLPVLVQSRVRWILPAFSPWAAGLNWKSRRQRDEKIWLISPKRIFAIGSATA